MGAILRLILVPAVATLCARFARTEIAAKKTTTRLRASLKPDTFTPWLDFLSPSSPLLLSPAA